MEVILEGLKVSKPRMAAMLKSSAILEKRSNTPVEKGMWLKCCSFGKDVWLGNDLRIVYKACVSVPDQALVKLSPPPPRGEGRQNEECPEISSEASGGEESDPWFVWPLA